MKLPPRKRLVGLPRPPIPAASPRPAAPPPESAAPSPEPAAPSPQTAAPSPQTAAPSPQTAAPSPQTAAPSPQTAAPSPQPAAIQQASFHLTHIKPSPEVYMAHIPAKFVNNFLSRREIPSIAITLQLYSITTKHHRWLKLQSVAGDLFRAARVEDPVNVDLRETDNKIIFCNAINAWSFDKNDVCFFGGRTEDDDDAVEGLPREVNGYLLYALFSHMRKSTRKKIKLAEKAVAKQAAGMVVVAPGGLNGGQGGALPDQAVAEILRRLRRHSGIQKDQDDRLRRHSDIQKDQDDRLRRHSGIQKDQDDRLRRHSGIQKDQENSPRRHSGIQGDQDYGLKRHSEIHKEQNEQNEEINILKSATNAQNGVVNQQTINRLKARNNISLFCRIKYNSSPNAIVKVDQDTSTVVFPNSRVIFENVFTSDIEAKSIAKTLAVNDQFRHYIHSIYICFGYSGYGKSVLSKELMIEAAHQMGPDAVLDEAMEYGARCVNLLRQVEDEGKATDTQPLRPTAEEQVERIFAARNSFPTVANKNSSTSSLVMSLVPRGLPESCKFTIIDLVGDETSFNRASGSKSGREVHGGSNKIATDLCALKKFLGNLAKGKVEVSDKRGSELNVALHNIIPTDPAYAATQLNLIVFLNPEDTRPTMKTATWVVECFN